MSISRKLRHRSEQLFDRLGKTRTDSYAYNTRSELTEASLGVNPYSYDYDNIGNRKTAQEIAQESTYAANTLNQYSAITRNQVPFTPTFDPDGNQTLVQTSTGIWKVTYNADSRPVRFTQQGGTTTIDCGYDYMGRRYEKKITVDGTITLHQHYLYRGYLQIAALDKKRTHLPALWYTHWDPTEPTATRPLSIRKSGTWYTYGCDLTKNVQELFTNSGAIATTYDYTPFGAVTRQGADQPFQWSSEVCDEELGLVYYNYRHYNSMDGRWINRDPIAEQGGHNLYAFVGNGGIFAFDYLGEEQYSTVKDAFKAAARLVLETMKQEHEKDIKEWESLTYQEQYDRGNCKPRENEYSVRICCKSGKYYLGEPGTSRSYDSVSPMSTPPCADGYKLVGIVHSHPNRNISLSSKDKDLFDYGFGYDENTKNLNIKEGTKIQPKTTIGVAIQDDKGRMRLRVMYPNPNIAPNEPCFKQHTLNVE